MAVVAGATGLVTSSEVVTAVIAVVEPVAVVVGVVPLSALSPTDASGRRCERLRTRGNRGSGNRERRCRAAGGRG